MVELVIRTLKDQCVHRYRFDAQQHASRAIGDWIRFCNTGRLHKVLGMKTPAMENAFAVDLCRKRWVKHRLLQFWNSSKITRVSLTVIELKIPIRSSWTFV
jgi:hypothetical protein